MNLSGIHSCFSNTQNSIQSLIFRCSGACVRRRQVHPEIIIPEDLEFVNLGSQRVIRVLHLPPQQSTQTVVTTNQSSYNTLNDEVRKILEVPSEEYWFTRSNRPFKAGDVCDCTSGTLASQEGISVAWKDVTNCFSVEVKESGGNARSSESYVTGCGNVFGKFAENFVRVVLNEAYGTAVSQQKCSSSTVESQNTIPENERVWYRESTSEISASCNNENLLPQVVTVAQVHHGDIDFIEDAHISEKDSCHSKNDVKALTCSSKDGIVNLSFSGTFSEPDDLASPFIREDQLVNSSESKLEVSSAEESSKFSICGAYVSSEPKKDSQNSNSKNLVTDEIKKSEEVPDWSDQRFTKHIRNDSLPKDDSTSIFNSKIVECSKGTEPKKVSIGDYIDKIIERKSDVDCCWHSKIIQKPSLLFLHGAGSSADIWSLQLQYFSFVGYEVIAPDMLGHGYSSAPDCPSAYAFDRLLQDVLQIFDRFILEHQKCVIIGHSYGSCFAAAVARYRPQQVVQLVLLSSGGPSPLVPSEAVFSFPSCIMSLMRPFLMCGFKRELFYGPRGKHLHPCCTYELPPYVLKHVERGQEWVEGDAAFHRRILVPTLLVHGLKDPYISLVEECEMERTIPRSFLEVISNAGHMVMLDTPEQLCHMIHSFITWWNS